MLRFLVLICCILQTAFAEPLPTARVIKFTDNGVVPSRLELSLSDSVVFLFNDTSKSLVSFELNLGRSMLHCNAGRLTMDSHGVVTSKQPLSPGSFVTTCFHDAGEYKMVVSGLPQGVNNTITVAVK